MVAQTSLTSRKEVDCLHDGVFFKYFWHMAVSNVHICKTINILTCPSSRSGLRITTNCCGQAASKESLSVEERRSSAGSNRISKTEKGEIWVDHHDSLNALGVFESLHAITRWQLQLGK